MQLLLGFLGLRLHLVASLLPSLVFYWLSISLYFSVHSSSSSCDPMPPIHTPPPSPLSPSPSSAYIDQDRPSQSAVSIGLSSRERPLLQTILLCYSLLSPVSDLSQLGQHALHPPPFFFFFFYRPPTRANFETSSYMPTHTRALSPAIRRLVYPRLFGPYPSTH